MISTVSGSIVLLQQQSTRENADAADSILNIVNNAKQQASVAKAIPTKQPAVLEQDADADSESRFPPPPPGNYLSVDDPSLPEEVRKVMRLCRRGPGPQYSGEAFYNNLLQAFGKPRTVTDLTFHGRVVEATTLAQTAEERWQWELDDAAYRTGVAVGAVAESNSSLHALRLVDEKRQDLDVVAVKYVNSSIENLKRIHDVPLRLDEVTELQHMGSSYFSDKVVQVNGEYKLSAYEIKSQDGRLLAEMKDNGHYITYNMDGSVRREMNRAEVCTELGSQQSLYSRLAGLLYDDEKDFQFY